MDLEECSLSGPPKLNEIKTEFDYDVLVIGKYTMFYSYSF